MEREIRAEVAAQYKSGKGSEEALTESILRKLDVLDRREGPKKLAAGWTRSADGDWIPPGFAPVAGYVPSARAVDAGGAAELGAEPPGEIV